MEDYKKEIEIDENDLDGECIKQPVLFDMITERIPDLQHNRDAAKIDIDRVYAEIDRQARELAVEEGRKITEKEINSFILNSKAYQKAQDDFLEVKCECTDAERIRDVFQQKKDMLKLLTELYIAGYWSTVEPKVTKEKKTSAIKDGISKKRRGKD